MQSVAWGTNEVSLRDYVDIIRRRKLILIASFIVVFGVGTVSAYMQKPFYRAGARMLLTSDSRPPMGALGAWYRGNDIDIATQIEVMKSESVMADAYQQADVPPGSVSVTIQQSADTTVLDIIGESGNGEYARRLVDELPKTYRKSITWSRREEINNSLEFTRARLKEEQDRLSDVYRELQSLKLPGGTRRLLTGVEGPGSLFDREAEAKKSAEALNADVAMFEARLASLIRERRSAPEWIETPTTITNPRIETLNTAISSLENQRAGLIVLYKPGAPEVQDIDARIKELKDRLVQTEPTVTTTAKTRNPNVTEIEGQIVKTRRDIREKRIALGLATAAVAKASANVAGLGTSELRQMQLVAEADRHKGSIADLQKTLDELTMRAKEVPEPVRVIAPARFAYKVGPRRTSNIVYAGVVGLLIGFCLALLQEYLDDRINTPEDARRILSVPALGYIPLVEESKTRLIREERGSSLLESYRVLRSNVRFASVGMDSSSILVASTVPGEGKSITVANLGVAMALDGRSVIVVDTDLRRPTLHSKFEVEQRPGLTNVLVGNVSLDDALQETPVPGLRVLSTGPLPPNPAELLNSPAMRRLHEELRRRADVVIFDSPPFLASADAQVLSADVDGVLYVVQFGEARKSALRHSQELMGQAHANLLGIVFNKISLTGHRDDYYYGYYRYYRYYDYRPKLEDGKPRRRRHQEYEAMLAAAETGRKPDADDENTTTAIEKEGDA